MRAIDQLEFAALDLKSTENNQQKSIIDDEKTKDYAINKLFRRRKHFRFRSSDASDGPLYIDPHLIDKLQETDKCIISYSD